MEHVPLTSFLLLTLLQLCRTELTQVLPGPWFSANAINDEFSPKPISELFSTEAPPLSSPSPVTFSVTDPIVVLPHSSTPQFSSLSTFFPSIKPSTFSSIPFSTPFTDLSSTPPPSTLTKNIFPSSSPITPSTMQTPTFIVDSTFSQEPREETPTVRIAPPQTSSTPLPTLRELFSSTREFPSSSSELPSSSINLPSSPSPSGSTSLSSTMPPNYFIIYQQAPQNIQGPPPSPLGATVNPPLIISTPSTLRISPITSTITSTVSSTTPTPTPFTVTIAPSVPSSPSSSITTPFPCSTAPVVRSTNLSTLSTVSLRPVSTTAPALLPQRTALPTRAPGLVIRLVAPKGSITNLKINPSTSTPRPRTKRTKKPKRNTYDLCLNSCRGKNPICTVPVGTSLIDPKTLKDFPSICHMACHNSYRNQAYEKLVDSRCSRLRTRIMALGSNQKLRREELRKNEYTLINPASPTLVEVINQNRR